MSGISTTPISTPPVNLRRTVASTASGAAGVCAALGAAAAIAGGVCAAMGVGIIQGCREVYRKCKEEGYPVERLQMAHTPISNFDGFKQMLETQGFQFGSINHSIQEKERAMQPIADSGIISDLGLSVAFNPLTSEKLFFVNSYDGIGVISENKELIQSSIQRFATQEIAFALRETGFNVNVETKGKDKIITAHDKKKNQIKIKIDRETVSAHIDTRKTRRPKCDLIHQLIHTQLNDKNQISTVQPQRKRKKETIHIKHRG